MSRNRIAQCLEDFAHVTGDTDVILSCNASKQDAHSYEVSSHLHHQKRSAVSVFHELTTWLHSAHKIVVGIDVVSDDHFLIRCSVDSAFTP